MERVLRSVAGVANEVIVADTGSTDRTAEIATRLGARVLPFAWQEDFSAARNFAIAAATGDWVLYLNPDEELAAAGRARLPALLTQDDALGYMVHVWNLLKADGPDHATETMQPRLFRRSAGVRYRGRLHPTFETPLDELARPQGKMIFATELIIMRHAYLSELTPDKLRWAVRLLELELRDRPGQLHYMIEYGRTLLRLNDPRGHAVLAEAVDLLLPACQAPAAPSPTVGSLLEYLLTVSPEQSRSRLSRAEAMELALRWYPRTPPVVWALAGRLFQDGDFAGAAPLLEDLLRMGRTGVYDRAADFQPDVMGAPAVLNLGVCYTRLGELDKAQSCFGQLLTNPAYQAQARQNSGMVEALRRATPAG